MSWTISFIFIRTQCWPNRNAIHFVQISLKMELPLLLLRFSQRVSDVTVHKRNLSLLFKFFTHISVTFLTVIVKFFVVCWSSFPNPKMRSTLHASALSLRVWVQNIVLLLDAIRMMLYLSCGKSYTCAFFLSRWQQKLTNPYMVRHCCVPDTDIKANLQFVQQNIHSL